MRINVGLRAPPPETIQARGGRRQQRHHARDRGRGQRRQGRGAVGDGKIRQPDIGEGEGIAVERFRTTLGKERIGQHARDKIVVHAALGRLVAVAIERAARACAHENRRSAHCPDRCRRRLDRRRRRK